MKSAESDVYVLLCSWFSLLKENFNLLSSGSVLPPRSPGRQGSTGCWPALELASGCPGSWGAPGLRGHPPSPHTEPLGAAGEGASPGGPSGSSGQSPVARRCFSCAPPRNSSARPRPFPPLLPRRAGPGQGGSSGGAACLLPEGSCLLPPPCAPQAMERGAGGARDDGSVPPPPGGASAPSEVLLRRPPAAWDRGSSGPEVSRLAAHGSALRLRCSLAVPVRKGGGARVKCRQRHRRAAGRSRFYGFRS